MGAICSDVPNNRAPERSFRTPEPTTRAPERMRRTSARNTRTSERNFRTPARNTRTPEREFRTSEQMGKTGILAYKRAFRVGLKDFKIIFQLIKNIKNGISS